jgi:plasmid stabilization system protein ParE
VDIRVCHLDRESPAQIHRFANLAEDLYREFRDNPRIGVDLDAVDHGSPVLVVKARTGLKGRVVQTIKRYIRQHGLAETVQV